MSSSESSSGAAAPGSHTPPSSASLLTADPALTAEVKALRDTLHRLKRAAADESEGFDAARVACVELLGHVLRQLHSLFRQYPALQQADLVQAGLALAGHVKAMRGYSGFHAFEDSEMAHAVNCVATSLTTRVYDYLSTCEPASGGSPVPPPVASGSGGESAVRQASEQLFAFLSMYDANGHLREGNCAGDDEAALDEHLPAQQLPTSDEEVDEILLRHPKGVDKALAYAKMLDKFTQDIMEYVDKRLAQTHEWAKELSSLAQTSRPLLQAESHLPFQALYCSLIDDDLERCCQVLTRCGQLQAPTFQNPLYDRRADHQKRRRALRSRWTAELKQLEKSVSSLKKAKTQYVERSRDYEGHRDAVRMSQKGADLGAMGESKVDKRRRLEEQALHKCLECEENYRRCVAEANERHRRVLDTKADLLRQIRELVRQCDQTVRDVSVAFFGLQHDLAAESAAATPAQFLSLKEESSVYDCGSQFRLFVCDLLEQDAPRQVVSLEDPFVFESFQEEQRRQQQQYSSSSSSSHARRSSLSQDSAADDYGGTYRTRPDRVEPSGAVVWPPTVPVPSDTDSESRESRDNSPTASPLVISRSGLSSGFQDEGDSGWAHHAEYSSVAMESTVRASTTSHLSASAAPTSSSGGGGGGSSSSASTRRSVAAKTHKYRKLMQPRKCRECDSMIISWKGEECQDCGMTVHRKCLGDVAVQCGFRPLGRRKQATFGVSVSQHLSEFPEPPPHVPPIVCKCAHEIEKRGLHTNWIYRTSGAKKKVDKLRQDFENSPPDLVMLTDISPIVISNTLKSYFQELPEPLMTYKLYSDFVQVVKSYPESSEEQQPQPADGMQPPQPPENVISALTTLCRRLTKPNLRTLAFLIHHLARVARERQANNMGAEALGVVWGPNLMRSRSEEDSLPDAQQLNRTVQLLIENAAAIFGPADSVLPPDYDRYTNPLLPQASKAKKDFDNKGHSRGQRGAVSKKNGGAAAERSASVAVPSAYDSYSGVYTGEPTTNQRETSGGGGERRSFDAGGGGGGDELLPGACHVNERESNEDYGSEEEDDGAKAIPSCWLPDESGRTKRSPLASQAEIIKVSLGQYSGVEGMTPERLSTQDSMESGGRLAKQPSSDAYHASSASNSRRSIPHDGSGQSGLRQLRPTDGLFARMANVGKKHSLDEDYLSPPPSAHPSLGERHSGEGSSSTTPLTAPPGVISPPSLTSSSLPTNSTLAGRATEASDSSGGGTSSSVMRSSTSPGSGRSSLVIGIGGAACSSTGQTQSQGRSSSLSEDHHHHHHHHHQTVMSSAPPGGETLGLRHAEHRVRIQVQTSSGSAGNKPGPVTKQSSVDKGEVTRRIVLARSYS